MNGYTLTLTAFLLIGGSLGDRFGRRKVYLTGIVWFTLASAGSNAGVKVAPMAGRAILTTVASSEAIPEPSTVIASTHRPGAEE
jgi:MFS family permease